jgi:hypothetical protein
MAKLATRSDAEALFWRAMWFLLILGFASWWGLKALLLWNPGTANWIGCFLGIGIWTGAIALCALVLKAISRGDNLLQALAVMWRPLVLLGAAAYLLFVNNQGRELGGSLMGEKNGSPLIFLFFALIYWAANNWHTARLGIHAALERGALGVPTLQTSRVSHGNQKRRFVRGDEPWLYWPPRLLGVCAHFFVAINLSLAARGLPLSAWGESDVLRWLAWTAPFAILLATAFVWAEDVKRSSRGRASASSDQEMLARRIGSAAVCGEILLFSGLAGVAFLRGVPQEFLLGTISTSLSAFAFLVFVSWLRNRTPPIGPEASPERRAEDDRQQHKEIARFTLWLFLFACLVALAVWISPTYVGRYLGSMVVACFAFGAILALVNAFEFAVVWTTKRQWFAEGARPHVVGAYAVVFAIGLAMLNAWLHPFHRVRLCDGGDCVAPKSAAGFSAATVPNERPTVADAARAWHDQAKAAYAKANGDGPVPMLIVATAGGGIRAAYWTATILERLEKDLETEGGVRPYLFAISGVSGGSVGAAAFEAALAQRDESNCKAGDAACPLATKFLSEDFLAPALASWVFVDTPSSFLPDFGQDDRGTTIEKSLEHASGELLARPFLSFFRYSATNYEQAHWWRPILLLNATHEETGRRIITGHVRIERNVFLDSLDALYVLGKDVRASTAAHNSARFTYVSPAGDLGNRKGSVIDGGYFENYGALSALELARAAKEALKDKAPGVKLVILMISSDPGLDKTRRVRINEANDGGKCLVSIAEREHPPSGDASDSRKSTQSPNYLSLDGGPGENRIDNPWVNQFLAPFQGIYNVRGAHGNLAAAELAVEICTELDESLKTAGATLARSKDANLEDSHPFKARRNKPYFAHLAMCTDHADGESAPIQPPLGWVLSKETQDNFKRLLENNCDNMDELAQLETALGKSARQQAAGP